MRRHHAGPDIDTRPLHSIDREGRPRHRAMEVSWQARIRAEYHEMPGLSLTLPQMARLWGLPLDECERVADVLVQGRELHRTSDGRYVVSSER